MPFWLWKPRRHSRSRAKSRFPKCLRAPRAGAFLSAGRKNFNSLPEKFVVRVDKSCQGEYNKRNITKMAVKRRVSFRMSLTRKPGGWKRAGDRELKMVSELRGRRARALVRDGCARYRANERQRHALQAGWNRGVFRCFTPDRHRGWSFFAPSNENGGK